MSLTLSMKYVLFAFLLMECFSLTAQGTPNEKDCVIWDNPNVILPIHPIVPSASHSIRYESPSGRMIKTVTVPVGAFLRDYLDGTLYSFGVLRERDPKDKNVGFSRHILWRREGEDWVIDAMIEAPRPVFFPIIPLKNGKYLLVGFRPIIEDETGAHLFGIYRKNKKKQLELEKPLTEVFSKPSWPRAGGQQYSLEDLTPMGNSFVCRTDRKIVVHFPYVGWFFVFSPDDGRFLRKARVFIDVTEEDIRAGREFGPVGLGFEPRQDGRIVFATMSKEFVLLSAEMFPRPPLKEGDLHKGDTMAEYLKNYKEAEGKKINKWPQVLWWEFDPDTGTFDKILTPEGFPDKLKDWDDARNFDWRIRANGTLVRFDPYTDVVEPPKKKWRILEMFDMR